MREAGIIFSWKNLIPFSSTSKNIVFSSGLVNTNDHDLCLKSSIIHPRLKRNQLNVSEIPQKDKEQLLAEEFKVDTAEGEMEKERLTFRTRSSTHTCRTLTQRHRRLWTR